MAFDRVEECNVLYMKWDEERSIYHKAPTSLTDDVRCEKPVICCILRSGMRQLQSVCTTGVTRSSSSFFKLHIVAALCVAASAAHRKYHFVLLTAGHLAVLKGATHTYPACLLADRNESLVSLGLWDEMKERGVGGGDIGSVFSISKCQCWTNWMKRVQF